MAQEFVAKEVKPPKGPKAPTHIITEDGSDLSGFHEGLKAITPGTRFRAEIKVSKGYMNIDTYEILSGPGVAPGTAPGPGATLTMLDARALAGIKAIAQMALIAYLMGRGLIKEDDPTDKKLVAKLKDWLLEGPAVTTAKTAPAPKPAEKTGEPEVIFVTDASSLMKWAIQHGPQYTPSWVRKEGGIGPEGLITDDMAVKAAQRIADVMRWELP
jgi:hypothetical protein